MLYLIIWHSLVLKKQQLFPYQIINWNYFEKKKNLLHMVDWYGIHSQQYFKERVLKIK
jgi:hypothetical protein